MAKKVVWTFPLRADLRDHLEYLLQHSQRSAATLLDEVEAAAGSLVDLSARGRIVPELGRSDRREILVRNCRLIYRVDDELVIILRMIQGKQDFLAAWRRAPS